MSASVIVFDKEEVSPIVNFIVNPQITKYGLGTIDCVDCQGKIKNFGFRISDCGFGQLDRIELSHDQYETSGHHNPQSAIRNS